MSVPTTLDSEPAYAKRGLPALPFYYGWVIVVLSALAMVATFPGRSHGLGTITERLIADPDLQLTDVVYGEMNLWATILGAVFCFPCGRLLDRFGTRLTLTAVTVLLGAAVVAMTHLTSFWLFFGALLLTRGFGQSALSVVSLAMVGKWFTRRLSLAMGIYTVLMAVGFITTYQVVGKYREAPWQTVWSGLGYALLFGMAPLAWLFVRNTPEEYGLSVEGAERQVGDPIGPASGYALHAALAEPIFWAFALATSMYGLVSSGVSLFNEKILVEQGFTKDTYYTLLKITPGIGLAGNFLAGWLVQKWTLRGVMGLSMALLAGSLFWFPLVASFPQILIYAVAWALGGGMMTVVFFTAFGQVFGRRDLGQIQGIAQMLTVFASALGQALPPWSRAYFGTYRQFFVASASVVVLLGLWACFLKVPAPVESDMILNKPEAA